MVLAAVTALLAVPACPATDDRDEILSSGKKLYSQFDEELVIRHFFDDRRDGLFVDVGAYDWKDSSTTYYLEKHLGWSGLAIDALDQFREGYVRNRPGTKFFNYIVTDHSGTMDTLYVAGPVSSTEPSHVRDVSDFLDDSSAPEHPSKSRVEDIRDWWAGIDRGRPTEKKEFIPKEVRVPTITLTELLDQNGVTKVDFLSMDIEQGEPAALAGFDIERFQPELVCVEAFAPVRGEIAAYFEAHGYERIYEYEKYDDINWYFRPRRASGPE
jgi:FkbM family methyltransferase